jgi:hypothetical protein
MAASINVAGSFASATAVDLFLMSPTPMITGVSAMMALLVERGAEEENF